MRPQCAAYMVLYWHDTSDCVAPRRVGEPQPLAIAGARSSKWCCTANGSPPAPVMPTLLPLPLIDVQIPDMTGPTQATGQMLPKVMKPRADATTGSRGAEPLPLLLLASTRGLPRKRLGIQGSLAGADGRSKEAAGDSTAGHHSTQSRRIKRERRRKEGGGWGGREAGRTVKSMAQSPAPGHPCPVATPPRICCSAPAHICEGNYLGHKAVQPQC